MTPTIRHPLPDDLLLAYTTGSLPEAFNLLIATHLSLCVESRATVAAFDALGGALLDSLDADPDGEAGLEAGLQAVLRRLDQAAAAAPARPARRHAPGIFPAPLQDHVGGDLAAVRWRPVGMGVRQAILKTGPGARARLLHIPAGAAVPDHGHHGRELTLVLQGAFSDAGGRFARGDVEVADPQVEHTPKAEPGEDCICLAATDAPLRFRGLLPRLVQPFLKI